MKDLFIFYCLNNNNNEKKNVLHVCHIFFSSPYISFQSWVNFVLGCHLSPDMQEWRQLMGYANFYPTSYPGSFLRSRGWLLPWGLHYSTWFKSGYLNTLVGFTCLCRKRYQEIVYVCRRLWNWGSSQSPLGRLMELYRNIRLVRSPRTRSILVFANNMYV